MLPAYLASARRMVHKLGMSLPPDQCERIFAGETPIRVWREFRGLAVTDLRKETGIGVARLEALERGIVKPTRAERMRLARALDLAAHDLEPHGSHFAGCSALDVDEDAILAGAEETDAR